MQAFPTTNCCSLRALRYSLESLVGWARISTCSYQHVRDADIQHWVMLAPGPTHWAHLRTGLDRQLLLDSCFAMRSTVQLVLCVEQCWSTGQLSQAHTSLNVMAKVWLTRTSLQLCHWPCQHANMANPLPLYDHLCMHNTYHVCGSHFVWDWDMHNLTLTDTIKP